MCNLEDDTMSKQTERDAFRSRWGFILACIGSDTQHAANDIRGLSVFDLPADAPVLAGAREALTKLEIL